MNEVKEEFRSAKSGGLHAEPFPSREDHLRSIDTVVENANAITMALQDDGRRAIGLRLSIA